MLKKLCVGMNIPPFMEHLLSEEMASLTIHVKRAVGRIKTYRILTSTPPLSMAFLSNQIVCISCLTSTPHSQPPHTHIPSKADIDKYFEELSETESDDTSDSNDDFD